MTHVGGAGQGGGLALALALTGVVAACRVPATPLPPAAPDGTATAVPRTEATVAPPTLSTAHAAPTAAAAGATADLGDLIRVAQPAAGDVVASPLAVSGEARGTWFFEADFPVTVEDSAGNELGRGVARADREWMTADFVPFTAEITFVPPEGARDGLLVLHRANPSGMSEHDKQLVVPVRFR